MSQDYIKIIYEGHPAKLDIVAVHGLNPLNKTNYGEAAWTLGNKIWLKDFLPTRMPHSRILIFAYNSNIAFATSTAGLREAAESLLLRLSAERRGDASERSLIFIAHSLGGLVVKRALVTAKLDKTYGSISRNTHGIAFFSTPHRGGTAAELGDVVANIVRFVRGEPPNTFMEALKKSSLLSQELTQDFRHQLEDYHILSFYETKPPPGLFRLVVDKQSATLGLAGDREKQVAVASDHRNICKFDNEEDNNYKQIAQAFVAMVQSASGRPAQIFAHDSPIEARQSHFVIPYSRNQTFVSRQPELDAVAAQLSGNGHRRVAIYGLGGVGKSQIAIEFAYQYHQHQGECAIFWIHASNEDRFRHSYSQIARACNIFCQDGPQQLEAVRDWLRSGQMPHWLLIVDNADDVDLLYTAKDDSSASPDMKPRLAHYIPDGPFGKVLLTTRNKQVALKLTRPQNLVEVTKMADLQSTDLLESLLDKHAYDDKDELRLLARHLDHLPLALAQAAAFISENFLSVRDYINVYNTSADVAGHLLSVKFEATGRDAEVSNALAVTMTLTLDLIKKNNLRAAEMLSMIAFCDWQDIPVSLLLQEGEDATSLDFLKACGYLQAFSLISRTGSGRSFEMHRLMHLVTRRWVISTGGADMAAERAVEVLDKKFPRNPEPGDWRLCATLLPHAQSVLSERKASNRKTGETQLSLLTKLGEHFHNERRFYEASDIRREAIATAESVFSGDHEAILTQKHHYAETLVEIGQVQDAMKLELLVTRQCENTGLRNTLYADSLKSLGKIYAEQGKFDEAISFGERALKITKEIHGNESLLTLRMMIRLADVLENKGKYQEAENLLNAALATLETLTEDASSVRVIAESYLSIVYLGQRRLTEAALLAEQVLAKQQSVLGVDHAMTLLCCHNLATMYLYQQRLDDGIALEARVFDRRRELFGAKHPDTLLAQKHLADFWKAQGDYNMTQSKHRQAQNDYKMAVGLLSECFTFSQDALGPEHRLTIRRRRKLERWKNFYTKNFSMSDIT